MNPWPATKTVLWLRLRENGSPCKTESDRATVTACTTATGWVDGLRKPLELHGGCGACFARWLHPRAAERGPRSPEPDAAQPVPATCVGADGWCRHYDTGGRACRILRRTVLIFRVSNLPALFGVPSEQSDAFAIACCTPSRSARSTADQLGAAAL